MSLNQAVISVKNAVHNFNQIKSSFSGKLICVVKANAYGHGAELFAKLYEKLGADGLAVFTAKEGAALRRKGVTLPILCLGFTPKEDFDDIVSYGLIQSVYSLEYAKMLSAYARKRSFIVNCHLKLDTGMSRLGFNCDKEGVALAQSVLKLPNLKVTGLYTHFSCADSVSDAPFTLSQWRKFNNAKKELFPLFKEEPFTHAQNTAALKNYPDLVADGARVGLSLYGYGGDPSLKLKPVMSFDSEVASVKIIPAGERVGYGGEFLTKKPTRVAVLTAGYNDGLRQTTEGACVQIGDILCPVLGKICMNMTMVEVEGARVNIGDKARFFGFDCINSAESLAKAQKSSVYETLCNVGNANERLYV